MLPYHGAALRGHRDRGGARHRCHLLNEARLPIVGMAETSGLEVLE
jgi:hypothetical protein